MNWLKLPKKVYFKKGSTVVATKELRDIYHVKHALIITDANLFSSPIVQNVETMIKDLGIRTAEFFTAEAQPTIADAYSGLPKMQEFQPDAIVAIGGGSVMNLAKVMFLIYEHPEIDLRALMAEYGDVADAEKDMTFPVLGQKAKLFAIATSGGSGAECSPFAVIRDEKTGICSTISSYQFIPEMAIIDADHSLNAPADITKAAGQKALTLAVRALLSPDTNEYIYGMAKDAVRNVFQNLDAACKEGAANPAARIKMSDAAALAGIAYGNACPSLNPKIELYPGDADKDASALSAAQLKTIAELAEYCGVDVEGIKTDKGKFTRWIKACEALIAD